MCKSMQRAAEWGSDFEQTGEKKGRNGVIDIGTQVERFGQQFEYRARYQSAAVFRRRTPKG
ncbi:MAG: hypothetical protein CMJ46_06545 [Planctomyces sp.]|nr:hypothetical protein [Planctomyces sp.]